MAQQNIIIGAVNAKNGDSLFTAFTKIEANTTETYATAATNAANIAINVTDIATNAADIAANKIDNRIIVRQSNIATTLGGVIDSTKVYLIDGIIDMGTVSAEVPVGGISLRGIDAARSQLVSSENNYEMFTSPVGGSGSISGVDLSFDTIGANSRVFNLVGATGNESFEWSRVNFNNCNEIGIVNNYRQGLEENTGRFGVTPTLTLAGVWAGGYRCTTSITRGLAAGGTGPLFKAGGGFTMASRFLTDMNVNLNTLMSFTDFVPGNFINSSSLQLHGMIITRNGAFEPNDTNYTPNITASDLVSSFKGNVGLPNTFVGGETDVATEAVTTITTAGAFVDLNAGSWVTQNLVHFNSPAGGQLKHLGVTPREFTVFADMVLDSTANDEVDLKLVIYRDATASFEDSKSIRRVINNLQGGRDVASFTIRANVELNKNDYIKLQVANVNATNNITAEVDAYLEVGER
tara:strand:+ start:2159 stop:3550 length:1392 start_codon:yes stop_codon:yes gene_type:complete